MKKIIQVTFCLAIFLLIMCKSVDLDDGIPKTILIDAENLAATKLRIEKKDPTLQASFDKLILDAEAALRAAAYSVTDKEKLPPSGDKHDYASYSRYWWPDPDQPDGLPYIRRDGETNPASQSPKESDRLRIGALGRNTETLGLAYCFTGKEKYANKAAEMLRTWFLDPSTRMNPNVNHAQCRPGHNTGTKSGILDGRLLIRALEGSLLIAASTALSDAEHKSLQAWVAEYFEWLTTNEMALQEAASKNNHGSFYDAQALYFALFAGEREAATQLANQALPKRILSQIEADGSMPEEMARTRPLFYSIYNLHALFLVAKLAEQVEVDLWKANDSDSRLRAALDHLAPYSDPQKPWPQPTLREANRMELFPILLQANRVYPNGNYLNWAEQLPAEQRHAHRANLVFPLMR